MKILIKLFLKRIQPRRLHWRAEAYTIYTFHRQPTTFTLIFIIKALIRNVVYMHTYTSTYTDPCICKICNYKLDSSVLICNYKLLQLLLWRSVYNKSKEYGPVKNGDVLAYILAPNETLREFWHYMKSLKRIFFKCGRVF